MGIGIQRAQVSSEAEQVWELIPDLLGFFYFMDFFIGGQKHVKAYFICNDVIC